MCVDRYPSAGRMGDWASSSSECGHSPASDGSWRTQSYVHDPVAFCDPNGLAECWGAYFKKLSGTNPPEGMENPHAHHIIFKGEFANNPRMQAQLARSRAIADKYGIDPVYDKEALMWAQNSGHSVTNAKAVADRLTQADAAISRQDLSPPDATAAMTAELQRIGQSIFGSNSQ
jgi:hypothetical protein